MKYLNKYQAGLFAVLCFFFFCLTGCDKIDFLSKKKFPFKRPLPAITVKGTIIAKVNTIPITLEDLNEEIEAYNTLVPADRPEQKITTRDNKIKYLKNEMVRRALLYQDALDRGLSSRPEVVRVLEKTKMDLLVMELIRDEAGKVDVSSKEIEDYYNTYKEQLKEPEERQIREIVVNTEPEARDILIQLLQGGDFSGIARDRSKSSSSTRGGDLGFITRGKKFAQFDEVAFSETLDVGKISSIFKGPDGYYLVKIEAKRGGKQRSLSELWDDIKRGLLFLKQQQKIEDLTTKLSREAKIEVYEGEIR